jgi:hypothetical protein
LHTQQRNSLLATEQTSRTPIHLMGSTLAWEVAQVEARVTSLSLATDLQAMGDKKPMDLMTH